MAELTRFQVTGTWEPSSPDGEINGAVSFTMLIEENGVLAAPTLDTPAVVVPTVKRSAIDSNVLNPVPLLANTAALNLAGTLYYRADFFNVYYSEPGEEPVELTLESITFEASTDTTEIDLVNVTPAAGLSAVQLLSVLAENILDATALGRELVTAAGAATARSNLNAASYLGPIASDSAMLALTGNLGDYCFRTDLGEFLYLTASPSTTLTNWAVSRKTHSITDYGAKCDGQYRFDAAISSGTLNKVNCAGYNFTSIDIGKTVILGSQGGQGATPIYAGPTPNQAFVTTITGIAGNAAILAAPATRAVTSCTIAWGTDDSAAWTAALTAAANSLTGFFELTMPTAVSICGEAISLAPTRITRFSLRGSSAGTSQIICTAAGGFLTLNLAGQLDGGQLANIDFADLNLIAAYAGAEHALSVNLTPPAATTNRHAVTMNRITCGTFDAVVGYWDKPIELIAAFRPILRDVLVFGLNIYQPLPGTGDFSDTSLLYLPTCGINLNDSYSSQLFNTQVFRQFRGIQSISTLDPTVASEFFMDNNCQVQSCREGVYLDPSSGQSADINVRGAYFNNRDFNVFIEGASHGIISHNNSWFTPNGWSPSSTLATAVTTGSNPTTLTVASTAGFPEVGAVLVDAEWFTYSNISTGMNGTTLNNVVRAQFGSVDPGSSHAIGATVTPAQADVLLIDCNDIHVDNNYFVGQISTKRISTLLHSGNTQIGVSDNYTNTSAIAVAVGNDSAGTVVWGNRQPATMTAILDGAPDTIWSPVGDLVPTSIKTSAYTAVPNDLVLVNATSAGVPIQFPADPPGQTRIGVIKTDSSTNIVTVNAGGTDCFHGVGGPTSTTAALQHQAFIAEYDKQQGFWFIVNGALPLSGLDARYQRALAEVVKKTANYTAAANQLVPVDASAGAVTVTFPTAPADGTRDVVKKVDSSANAVSLALGGSDVFNVAGGPTTVSLSLQNQAIQAQYDATHAIWYVISTDVPLSGLDARYLNQSTTGNAATATKLATARNINGVAFDGSAAITVADSTAEKTANKNQASGYAGLDSGGKVPAALWPSGIDEIIEYANLAAFPGTGASGTIYLALDTGKVYRWSGSVYVEISPSPGSTDAVTEGVTNLYYTNARADARVALGNAATATKLATPRNINGVAFDGSAAIAVPDAAFNPVDYGWISWNYDPTLANTSTTGPTAGQAYLSLLPIRIATTVTNVILNIATAGSGLTSGQCFAGLFNSSGTLLAATADQSSPWATPGLKTQALTTPQAISAGIYYVGIFGNGTTLPKFRYISTAIGVNGGQFTASPRYVIDSTNTGLTTAFHSPATLTSVASLPFWAAVS